MTDGRRLCAILVVIASAAWATQAQAQITAGMIASTTALSPQDQAKVDEEVRRVVTSMISSPDEKIVDSRNRLLDPFERGPSEIFKRAYSQSLARELSKAIASDRAIVRVNTMIVASKLQDGAVALLVERGLADENPGVRYWSAKALNLGAQVSPDNRTALLAALTDVMKTEKSSEILEQVLGALVSLDAFDRVLGGLNDRVTMHAQMPGLAPTADTESLRRLYQKLVQDAAAGKTIDPATLQELARASYRLLDLAVITLDTSRAAADQASDWRRMIEVSDAALRWTALRISASTKMPAELKPDVAAGNWASVRLRVGDWIPILTAEPFNIKSEDLATIR